MSLLAQTAPSSFVGPESRRITRTSMLVAATLRIGDQALAVRIRNMSATGALVEGAVLPLPNCRVELVRGALRVTGQVAWIDGNRCGVVLDDLVKVDCWILGKAPLHQALVDTMVDAARRDLEASPGGASAVNQPISEISWADVTAGDEIDAIIASLAVLGDRLTDDPVVVSGHLVQLQALDEAQQRLAALKRRLA